MAGPTPSSGGVFISYRRRDTAPYARLLREELSRHPSTGRVFMDVDSIEVGVDFAEAIERAVGTCEVLLALVGPQWLTITDADGQRRLDDPDDTVRLEIEAALQRDIRVIPVLVDNTPMPRRHQLPPSLAPLARRNALELSYDRYAYDLGRLLKAVEKVLGHPAGPAPTPAPARSRGATGTQRSAGSTSPAGGTGSQRVVQLLRQGEASIRGGSDDEALRVAEQALQLDPDNPMALVLRARVNSPKRRDQAALADFDRALELQPNNAFALTRRANHHHARKRYDAALRDHNRALELKPSDTFALASRGLTQAAMTRHDAAFRDFNRALELRPNDTYALVGRGRTYQSLKRYDEALRDINRALELDPGNKWAKAVLNLMPPRWRGR